MRIICHLAYFHKCNTTLMLSLLSYLACGVGPMQYSCRQQNLTFVRLKFHQSMQFHSTEWQNPSS